MSKELQLAQELIDFIYESPTAFHAVEKVKGELLENGYVELLEEEKWNLKKGGKYFVIKNESAITAFVVGQGEIAQKGFKIVGAHTDSPCFRVKPCPEMVAENAYLKLNTETYGGAILNTWMDRPLSLAGRVTLRSESVMEPVVKLVNIKRPILIIPNLSIHMNRNVNSGIELNKQKDMLPLLAMMNENMEKDNFLLKAIAAELKVPMTDILDFDLFLYEFEKGSIIGFNNEFISAGRLDDLSMVHAGLKALLASKEVQATNVLVCFDNEEVGSSTKQGANSPLLSSILERIVYSLGGNREDYFRSLAKSFLISADLAHAVHPNSPEKADPILKPVINKGPVIKVSANQKYTTDSVSSCIYEEICKKAEVPVQKFVNRSDAAGGSTIGPISSTQINIRCVDMGSPIFGMHSIREMGGVLDHTYTTKSFEGFYNV